MEYQKIKLASETITIKDAEPSEIEGLIPIYKENFPRHNVFQKLDEEILEYLLQKHNENIQFGGGFIVARTNKKVVGGMLLRKESEDLTGSHVIWKYNHVAVDDSYEGKGIGSALLKAADEKIRKLIKEKKFGTAKIELGVAENDKEALEFYKKNDFKEEGRLKSHYRFEEMIIVCGKEIS